jgi:hypothetical protein
MRGSGHKETMTERESPPDPLLEGGSPARNDRTDSSESWENVRDSWMGSAPDLSECVRLLPVQIIDKDESPPSSLGPKTLPPPLPPDSVRAPPIPASMPFATPDERTGDLPRAQLMLERLAASDYQGALFAAQAILRTSPRDTDAEQCAAICGGELCKLFDARLGSRNKIPSLAIHPSELRAIPIDTQAGLVLSLVNGRSTISEIVALGPLEPMDSIRILSELFLLGAIELKAPAILSASVSP